MRLSLILTSNLATSVYTVLILATTHHDHPVLVLRRDANDLLRLRRVVFLSVVCRKLIFVLQKRILTYGLLLHLLWELLSYWSHHA